MDKKVMLEFFFNNNSFNALAQEISANKTLFQSVAASVGLRQIFSSSNSASMPVSLLQYPFAPRTHIFISDEALPSSTGMS